MDKIYSRKRIKLPNIKFEKFSKRGNKIIKILAIMCIAIITAGFMIKSISPIFDRLCEAEAKSLATKISNDEVSKVMKNYEYEDIVTVMKDNNGNITAMKSNIVTINKIISEIAIQIQKSLESIENKNISIRLGSFTGSKILAGRGPKIKIRISSIGDVETNFKSEFKEAGINQTLHRVYLEVNCKVAILTPINTIERSINNQVILAENIIVGTTPNTYYNLEGMNDTKDAIEVIE